MVATIIQVARAPDGYSHVEPCYAQEDNAQEDNATYDQIARRLHERREEARLLHTLRTP